MGRARTGTVIYPTLDTVVETVALSDHELFKVEASSSEMKNGDLVWAVRVGVLVEDELAREELKQVEGFGLELATACADAIAKLRREVV